MVDPAAFACAVLPEAAAILAHSGAGLALADAVGVAPAAALAHSVAPRVISQVIVRKIVCATRGVPGGAEAGILAAIVGVRCGAAISSLCTVLRFAYCARILPDFGVVLPALQLHCRGGRMAIERQQARGRWPNKAAAVADHAVDGLAALRWKRASMSGQAKAISGLAEGAP